MSAGVYQRPSSRANKKQIIAHLEPHIVSAVHKLCDKENRTRQEVIAEAINREVGEYGRKPFLKVRRDRLIRRTKSIAKAQVEAEGVRQGKVRIAAWFDKDDVDKVIAFSKEVGVRTEAVLHRGLLRILGWEVWPKSDEGWDTTDYRANESNRPQMVKAPKGATKSKVSHAA